MAADVVEQIAWELRRAAERGQLLPYQRFHALFAAKEPLVSRYAALEKAVALLGEASDIDYGVLLALDNGLPAAEFFTRFKRNRLGDYLAVMGSVIHEQSLKRKRLLALVERQRVFNDAKCRSGGRAVRA